MSLHLVNQPGNRAILLTVGRYFLSVVWYRGGCALGWHASPRKAVR